MPGEVGKFDHVIAFNAFASSVSAPLSKTDDVDNAELEVRLRPARSSMSGLGIDRQRRDSGSTIRCPGQVTERVSESLARSLKQPRSTSCSWPVLWTRLGDASDTDASC